MYSSRVKRGAAQGLETLLGAAAHVGHLLHRLTFEPAHLFELLHGAVGRLAHLAERGVDPETIGLP